MVEQKEQEKVDIYSNLGQNIKEFWILSQVVIVPVVTRAGPKSDI